jgi:hypothetical protein
LPSSLPKKQVLPGWTTDDVIGSPYAITTYTCNQQIGVSDSVLVSVRKKLNSWGVRLMLDFVPNHSAVDCAWTTTNPDYYIRAVKNAPPDPAHFLPNGIAYGSSCAGCGSWPDTAQFNIFNTELRQQRLNELYKVASLADAIRCDMAYLLLNDVFAQTWQAELSSWGWKRPSSEFWGDAIASVKTKFPSTVFLAEVWRVQKSELK